MIRIDGVRERLRASERFGLDTLIDLSRSLVADSADCDLVRLIVTEEQGRGELVADLAPARLQRGEGAIHVGTATLRAIAEVAGGAVEQRSKLRDKNGRVPASENPLVAAGRSREPMVSRLAMELRKAVLEVAGRRPVRFLLPWPQGYRWAAVVTHDLDVVEWWALFPLLRMLELGRKRAWAMTRRVARAARRSIGHEPVSRAVHSVLQIEAHHSIQATWFIICADPTLRSLLAGDSTYRPDASSTREILSAITHAGHEVGLHGSFATGNDPDRMSAQRRRLGRLTDRPIVGVRQHFLRMRPGPTQRTMLEAGLEYDATWGFADRNGFRLGVADVVPAWDAAGEVSLPLDLVPLMWMDRALSKYSGVEEAQRWVDDGLELARECKAVEGAWVGLWHPNLTEALGFPDAEPAFVTLLRELADDRPYFASARKIVEWRRFRRSVRAAHVSASGDVTLTIRAGHPTSIALEDETGDTIQERVQLVGPIGAA